MNISTFSGRLIAMVFLVLISQIFVVATADQRTGDALEILISPGNGLIAQEARTPGLNYDGVSPYYDLVLQTVYVVNRGLELVTLQGGRIVVKSGERIIQTTALSIDEFARTSAKASAIKNMNFETGLQVLYSALSTLPDGIDIAPGPELPASTAGLVDDYYLITRELPDAIHIEVWGVSPDGNRIEGAGSFPVSTHESANEYIFPLEAGEWFILAFPGLRGHHRWTAATEHGYDITMVDNRGSWASGEADAFRTGRVPRWEDWYAYNKKVLAAADGQVVEVSDDVEFPLSFWNWRDDETLEEYRGRIDARQMELFMAPGANPAAVAGGNYILIKHANGEYSYYAHLAYGTVRVKPGQKVRQGEHIAGLGGTGEAPAVHLHFQISDGPDMMNSRTLPVQFSNIHVNEQFSDSFEPKIVFQPGFFINNR